MEGCRQDMPDANKVQIVPEGSADVTRPVVREQFGAVLNRYLSPTGRLLEGVIESIDEFYSANLGQDIKRGLRENASRGFFNGSRPPYGYHKIAVSDGNKTRYSLEPDADDSASVRVVHRIFGMAINDVGCKEIAKTLNKEGLRTGSGQR
jgi:site-specific DNA recombinase